MSLAQDALRILQNHINYDQSFINSIGGFCGWGGVIYTLSHLGVLWNQPDLLTHAESIAELIQDLIDKDKALDIIGGAAGCIGSLLSLYRCAQSERTLAIAIQCGDRLISCAQSLEKGIGWIIRGAGSKPLAGFSHGAAGMSWALLELSELTCKERFRKAALNAIEYEHSLFSPKARNWPDLREFKTSAWDAKGEKKTERFMTAWCHEAPGIGMARLHALKHLNGYGTELLTEINAALKATLVEGFRYNHSLCHGSLGNLDFLLQASQTLGDSQLQHRVYSIAVTILESIDKHGWLCGVPLMVETPGLMVGLAGIGYELLRLAKPDYIPSVLILAPPVI